MHEIVSDRLKLLKDVTCSETTLTLKKMNETPPPFEICLKF